ncbi:MAG TPA: RIP metalloprotease RseP [Gammaproteobacteria bacterium]|nr:RIP metalloprotease RseP [Gammaproteobacteria bacterium]
MSVLSSILWFVIAIGVLVTVHEFGHFWVARRLGVKVLRFSVGFGRPLWRTRAGRDQVEYVIGAIPLGGYVKMLDEAEGEVPESERHRAFNRQSLPVRFAVVSAGPIFNFLFAVVAYWAMFMVGVSGLKPLVGEVAPGSLASAAGFKSGQEIVRIADRETRSWEAVIQGVIGGSLHGETLEVTVDDPARGTRELSLDLSGVALDDLTRGQFFERLGFTPMRPTIPPRMGRIFEGQPADRAGLRPGDLILSVDDTPVETWHQLVEYLRARPEQTIEIVVDRSGQQHRLTLVPRAVEENGQRVGKIDAALDENVRDRYYAVERYTPLDAFSRAADKTAQVTVLTLQMLWKMVTLEVSVENLSGPISIAQYAGVSAEVGIARFLEFLGIVSISLGIINLLPIPLLDGGHLMYYLIELVQGRPVSEQAQFVAQRLGIAMLVCLMGLAFYNDLARIFG